MKNVATVKLDANDLLIGIEYADKALKAAVECETNLRIATRVVGLYQDVVRQVDLVGEACADLKSLLEKKLEKA